MGILGPRCCGRSSLSVLLKFERESEKGERDKERPRKRKREKERGREREIGKYIIWEGWFDRHSVSGSLQIIWTAQLQFRLADQESTKQMQDRGFFWFAQATNCFLLLLLLTMKQQQEFSIQNNLSSGLFRYVNSLKMTHINDSWNFYFYVRWEKFWRI